jgi:hypothetical protein
MGYNRTGIDEFIGKTFTAVKGAEVGSDSITWTADDGSEYRMFHDQDCCESVELADVVGDIEDLIGATIVEAYEAESGDPGPRDKYDDSYTWTFYRLRTIKGTVTLRWYGTSNGYYSEGVDIERLAESVGS